MSDVEVKIPDIGTDDKVDVVEVLVAAGERVAVDDGLVTLESDKASMDVPSTHAGTVAKITVKVGDKVGQGDVIAIVALEEGEGPPLPTPPSDDLGKDLAPAASPAPTPGSASEDVGEGLAPSRSEPERAGASPAPTPGSASEDVGEGLAPSRSEPERAGASPAPTPGSTSEDVREGLAPSRSESERAGASPAPTNDPDREKAGPAPEPPAAAGGVERGGLSPFSEATEVLVLGSGPGGYTAAFRAADLGKKVVLVERYATLGGVCLNVGCIPSKAYLHVARVIEEAADLGQHGISFGEPEIDLEGLRAWKDEVVGRLTSGLATMAKQRGVEIVTGAGHFIGPNGLAVVGSEGSRSLSFDHAIVATGSRVIEIPGIPYDDERVMDSTGALTLPEVPDKLLIVGGGIIGLEMACVYAALGSRITVVELLDGLIPGCDRDLVKPFERRLKKRYGAKIHVNTRVLKVESDGDGLTAFFEGKRAPESERFDRALVSVGRRPNSDRLNLESAGVRVGERGFIEVDSQMRTNVPHIFAIGDLVPGPMLAHKATHEGKVAAEAIAGEKSHFDARVIPSVAYTDPEIAWVGLTETEAKAAGTAYEVGSFPWAASGRAIGMGRTEGLTKLVFDPASKRVLGAGIVGPGAGDLISELALAIEMDCEAADIGLTIHPHPTLSETVAFSAEAFEGTITDLYLKKKKR